MLIIFWGLGYDRPSGARTQTRVSVRRTTSEAIYFKPITLSLPRLLSLTRVLLPSNFHDVLGECDRLFPTLLVIDQPHRLTPRHQHQRYLLSRAPIPQRPLRHP